MDRSILFVGLGGFLGSIARYFVTILLSGQASSRFPLATFVVNISGCFLIGVLFALSDRGNILSPEWRIFLATGFCGGFTTFSAFSYESIKLLQSGEILYLSMNVILSVFVGFAATYLGILLVRSI
ncbi:MAG: fluoride efflux transporter CrcB [Acidobacteriota bacterium]